MICTRGNQNRWQSHFYLSYFICVYLFPSTRVWPYKVFSFWWACATLLWNLLSLFGIWHLAGIMAFRFCGFPIMCNSFFVLIWCCMDNSSKVWLSTSSREIYICLWLNYLFFIVWLQPCPTSFDEVFECMFDYIHLLLVMVRPHWLLYMAIGLCFLFVWLCDVNVVCCYWWCTFAIFFCWVWIL